MREILGDLRTFPVVFDSVVGNMTSASRNIMEYVRYLTSWSNPYSRVSGDRESRRHPDPAISTTIRTAGIYITGGLHNYVKFDTFDD